MRERERERERERASERERHYLNESTASTQYRMERDGHGDDIFAFVSERRQVYAWYAHVQTCGVDPRPISAELTPQGPKPRTRTALQPEEFPSAPAQHPGHCKPTARSRPRLSQSRSLRSSEDVASEQRVTVRRTVVRQGATLFLPPPGIGQNCQGLQHQELATCCFRRAKGVVQKEPLINTTITVRRMSRGLELQFIGTASVEKTVFEHRDTPRH